MTVWRGRGGGAGNHSIDELMYDYNLPEVGIYDSMVGDGNAPVT